MPPRILVVEDDPSILRGLELNLQLEGFETRSAMDGRTALELVDDDIDLLILDLMIPYGADDYVTKPFRVAELIARVKAHLRRHRPETEVYRFSDVDVDPEKRLVLRAGEIVDLTPREYDLLAFLVQNEGRAVTRDAILEAVWGESYLGTDRTVDNFVTRLRQKLDQPGEPCHFLTVRGVGYRFVGSVS